MKLNLHDLHARVMPDFQPHAESTQRVKAKSVADYYSEHDEVI